MNEQILRHFAELIGRILARRWLGKRPLDEGKPPTSQTPLPEKEQTAQQPGLGSHQPE